MRVHRLLVAACDCLRKREQREGMLAVVAKARRHANSLLESVTFALTVTACVSDDAPGDQKTDSRPRWLAVRRKRPLDIRLKADRIPGQDQRQDHAPGDTRMQMLAMG